MEQAVVKVNIKWGKEKYDNVEVDTKEPPLVFKSQLFALTGVPPDRQKIMGLKGLKGGKLEDDADWATLGLKNGANLMLMGTAGELPAEPPKKTIFVEDLSEKELGMLQQAPHPPGLTNLGNTCYLNSTVQCLKAIPELNTAIKGYNGAGDDLLQQLKDLFISMDHSASAVPPLLFVHLFREHFPRFAQRTERGYAQQDAEECYGTLMHCLSQKLGPLTPEGSASKTQAPDGDSVIKQLFSGELEVRYKCLEGDEEQEAPKYEAFLKLMCNISSSTNFMFTGLKEGMTEKITKRSAARNMDVLYEKTQLISQLPYYLGIQFVRFWWKPDAQIKAKICRPVEFPLVLDVFDLCTDQLKAELTEHRKVLVARDEAKQAHEKKDAMDTEGPGSDLPPLWERKPYHNDTGYYELFGVITHKGRDAESGHYVAWVKEKDNQWLCFDDETVKPCKDEDIKQLAGKGGADWHIAYITFYRTKQVE